MVLAFAAVLAIEAALIRALPPDGWLSQLLWDARIHGVLAAASMAPAVWAGLVPGRISSRLPLSALCLAWIFIVWQLGMRMLEIPVAGIGYVATVLVCFAFCTAALLMTRRYLGIAIESNESLASFHRPPWQFQIRHLLFWTAAVGVTLAAGRLALPPEPPEFTASLLAHALRPDTQFSLALQCLITVPIVISLAFNWRWLPAVAVLALAAAAVSVLFDHWRSTTPLTLMRLRPTMMGMLWTNGCYVVQVLPLLMTLSLFGYRGRAVRPDRKTVIR